MATDRRVKMNDSRLAGVRKILDAVAAFESVVSEDAQREATVVHVLTIKLQKGRVTDCTTEQRRHHLQ